MRRNPSEVTQVTHANKAFPRGWYIVAMLQSLAMSWVSKPRWFSRRRVYISIPAYREVRALGAQQRSVSHKRQNADGACAKATDPAGPKASVSGSWSSLKAFVFVLFHFEQLVRDKKEAEAKVERGLVQSLQCT
jgi:hypothetical protein